MRRHNIEITRYYRLSVRNRLSPVRGIPVKREVNSRGQHQR